MTTPAGFADTVSTVDGHDPHQTDHRPRRPTAPAHDPSEILADIYAIRIRFKANRKFLRTYRPLEGGRTPKKTDAGVRTGR